MTTILLALFGAMVIGEALRPAVRFAGARIGTAPATGLVFGGLLVGLAALALLPLKWLFREVVALVSQLPWYADHAAILFGHVPISREDIGPLAAGIAHDPLGLGPAFSTLALSVVMALFWLGASSPLSAFTLSLLPENRRDDGASIISEIGTKLGAYVGGTLANMAIVMAAGTLGLVILHVPFALALGVLQGVLVAVPYLGTFIAVIAALLVVGSAQGALRGAEAALLIASVHSLEGSFISPLIFKKHVDVDPLGCVVATAAGGVLFGIPGVVLAVPAASVIKTLIVRVAAPAIRSRSVAVLAVLIVAIGTGGTARAADPALTGDQLLARAVATSGVTGYRVPINFDVHLLRPMGARAAVVGVATFTAPAQAALQITKAPPPIGLFFKGTYNLDIVPQTWAAKYHVTSVASSVVNGTPIYVLQAEPVPAAAAIDGVTFQISRTDFTPLSAQWRYHDGSSIKLHFSNETVGSLTLPLTATISVVMPGYALDASADYGTYVVTSRQ